MIIDRAIGPNVVLGADSIAAALAKIDANKARIIFCVDERGHLLGSLSDGDFRRWVVNQSPVDLSRPALEAANLHCVRVAADAEPQAIAALFRPGIDRIPLVDARDHLVAIALPASDELTIGRHVVGAGRPALLIAEIGINHNGSIDLAKRLVDLAAESGADVVKFQLRDMDALYRNDASQLGHGEDLGPQYTLDLLSKFSLSADQLFQVFDHCRDVDIDVLCTPWDTPSVNRLVQYGVPGFKVASADLTNHTLLRDMASHHLPMIVSTGMSTEDEIAASVRVIRATGTPFA
ncbi:MAG: N-acetylneuraminate synthase family protein, partial [Propionibacteriaceae bacterium]